jgi:hypothetical protein
MGPNFNNFANDPKLHARLATESQVALYELVEKDDRFAVVICPDDDSDSWEPIVCVIDLTNDESTDQPYVIILDHSDLSDLSDFNESQLEQKCQTIDFADVLRRIDAQIREN